MNGIGKDFAENILKMIVGLSTSTTTGASKYMALSSSEPTPAGGNITEPSSGTGYERALIGSAGQTLTQLFDNPSYNATTKKTTIKNKAQIKFNRLSANAGSVSYFAILDAATGGNLLFYGTLKDANGDDLTLTLNAGESAVIDVNGAVIELSPTTSE